MATQVPNRMLAFDGGNFAFRNKIINGNFNIWQRGTTFTGINNNTFTADRWTTTSSNAVANKNVSRQTLASTDLPATEAGLIYYLRGAYTSSTGTAQFAISNPIELDQTGAISPFKIGKTYTLSYYARCASNNNISYAVQFRNASGDPTNNVVIVVPNTPQAVTTSWARYSHTFTMTAPNVNNTSLCIIFTNDTVLLNTNIDITGVQLEEGSYATPFEQRPIGTELALCQRYFQYLESDQLAGVASTGSAMAVTYKYIVPMRTTPTITYGSRIISQAATIPGFGTEYIRPEGSRVYRIAGNCTVANAGTLGVAQITYYDLNFNAEL